MNYNINAPATVSFTHKSVINTGFLWALSGIVFALIPSMTGNASDVSMGYLLAGGALVVNILILIYSIKKFRDVDLGGYMTFGQGFLFIFFASIYCAVILGIFSYIQMTFIDPGMMDEAVNAQMAEMEKQGLTEEQIEAANSMTGFMKTPIFVAAITIFSKMIGGIIIGLILSAIFQKNPPYNSPSKPVYKDPNEETTI